VSRSDPQTPAGDDSRLSRADIVQAALDLVDEVGLDGLTMRRLADRLDVSPMGLYRHVRNKDDLVRALIDRTMRVTVLPEGQAPADPAERVVGFCVRLRTQMLEHPFLVPLILSRPDIRTDHPESVALIRAVLTAAGIEPGLVPTAFTSLSAFILGFVALETSAGADPHRTREFGVLLEPNDGPPVDDRFEIGARAILAGLRDAGTA
jgi:TetR/AcrR family transcriptional regulator, tetracycline repressor protein